MRLAAVLWRDLVKFGPVGAVHFASTRNERNPIRA